VKATINLAGTGTTLIVTADEYGSYFNAFKIKVIQGPIGGSGYRVVQLMENDGTTVIDQTDEFNDRTAVSGVQLGADDNVPVTITLGGGSGLPTVAAATALSSGTDDRASITQTQVDTALTYLSIDNGPGQVVSPNWQTNAAHDSLDAHAAANNRFAVATRSTRRPSRRSSAPARTARRPPTAPTARSTRPGTPSRRSRPAAATGRPAVRAGLREVRRRRPRLHPLAGARRPVGDRRGRHRRPRHLRAGPGRRERRRRPRRRRREPDRRQKRRRDDLRHPHRRR
jgi:hypothetical protein